MVTVKHVIKDIVRYRDIRFNFAPREVRKYWFNNDPWTTHLFNALFFAVPDGERWVMESARKQMARLQDPEMIATVRAFIRQEAAHSREHDQVNAMMLDYGLPSDEVEAIFRRVRERVQAVFGDDMQASISAAIEHFTAILSDIIMRHPELSEDFDPRTRALVYWHMIEETEHKAVSYDLFTTTVGDGPREYLMRTSGLLATFGFGFGAVFFQQFYLLYKDGQLSNLRSALKLLDLMFRKPALMSQLLVASLDYLRPGFHPWDHDNREVVKVWRDVFEQTQDPVAATEAMRAWQREQKTARVLPLRRAAA